MVLSLGKTRRNTNPFTVPIPYLELIHSSFPLRKCKEIINKINISNSYIKKLRTGCAKQ